MKAVTDIERHSAPLPDGSAPPAEKCQHSLDKGRSRNYGKASDMPHTAGGVSAEPTGRFAKRAARGAVFAQSENAAPTRNSHVFISQLTLPRWREKLMQYPIRKHDAVHLAAS